MTTTDARKRRAERGRAKGSTNILVSRAGLLDVAKHHRRAAEDFKALAERHIEAAAYIEGLVDGSLPADD